LVSLERAASVYGVVLTAEATVDLQKTIAARHEMQRQTV
jgi:hypothetical protein